MSGHSFYSEEEADEILRMAARDAVGSGAMDRQRLIETAAELGIPIEAVERAEAEVLAKREETSVARNETKERLDFRRTRKTAFWKNFGSYFGVNAICITIWFFTGRHYFWPGWILGLWALDIGSDLIKLVFPALAEDQFQKWRRNKISAQRVLTTDQGPEIEALLSKYADEEKKLKKEAIILAIQSRFSLDRSEAKAVVEDFDERNGFVFES